MTQSISLGLSIIATVISISSFLLNLRNTRRTQKLDTLQRRTQLLLRLNEGGLKIHTASTELRKMEWALLELKNNLPRNKEFNSFFADVESRLSSMQKEIAYNLKDMDDTRRNLDVATTVADASKIEAFLPKVDNVIGQSNIVLGDISAAMSQIEIGKNKLKNLNPSPKTTT